MRIGLAGSTSYLSKTLLISLIKNNNIPIIVYLKKDKKKGRGLKLIDPSIKNICKVYGIRILQPSVIDSYQVCLLKSLKLDFFIVASYGKILPDEFFSAVKETRDKAISGKED